MRYRRVIVIGDCTCWPSKKMENPFAVPPPLISRKRNAPAASDGDGVTSPFISRATFDEFSVDGRRREGEMLHKAEAARLAIRTAIATENATKPVTVARGVVGSIRSLVVAGGPTVSATAALPLKHLAEIVLEMAADEHKKQAENIARRISALTVEEHCQYAQLHHKRMTALAGGIPILLALKQEEAAILKRIEGIAKQEQFEFEVAMERLALKERKLDYQFVPPFVDRMYSHHLQACQNQVAHSYSRWYEAQLSVSIDSRSATPVERAGSMMKHVREIAATGECSVVDVADLKRDMDASELEQEAESICEQVGQWRPISADATAERLMDEFDCDVAMTSSTLLAMFDSTAADVNPTSEGWFIPVKNRVSVVKSKPRRTLYLDRPLPDSKVTAREKIEQAGKWAVINRLTGATNGHSTVRISYNIWQMGDIKILVRTTTPFSLREKDSKTLQHASIFVKPDHMPHGIEERISPSEFRRMWLHSWMRGGSAVVLCRLSPKTGKLISYSRMPLQSLLRLVGSPGFPAAFEPTDFFVGVRNVISTLLSLPTVNYLLQYQHHTSTVKQDVQVQIWKVSMDEKRTAVAGNLASAQALDLFSQVQKIGELSDELFGYVMPKWPPISRRIPYTFQTGSYCPEFLRGGDCDREIMSGTKCSLLHLRLPPSKHGIKWEFEDYSHLQASKTANKLSKARKQGRRVQPKFPFCRGIPDPGQIARLLQDVSKPIVCPKPSECMLPHMSMHDIAERVANAILRESRQKRKTYKARNKQRQQHVRDTDRGYDDGGFDDTAWY